MIKSSHGFLNTVLSEQNGPHFADNIFKYLFLNKNVCIFHQISLKFDYRDTVGNKLTLVQLMAWHFFNTMP